MSQVPDQMEAEATVGKDHTHKRPTLQPSWPRFTFPTQPYFTKWLPVRTWAWVIACTHTPIRRVCNHQCEWYWHNLLASFPGSHAAITCTHTPIQRVCNYQCEWYWHNLLASFPGSHAAITCTHTPIQRVCNYQCEWYWHNLLASFPGSHTAIACTHIPIRRVCNS